MPTLPDGTQIYTIPGGIVLTAGTGDLAALATGVLRDEQGNALPMYDLNRQPVTQVVTTTMGTFPDTYTTSRTGGTWDFGSARIRTYPLELLQDAAALAGQVAALAAAVERLESSGGSGGGGASTLAGISDMSDFARLLNQAASATAARERLGAGTSSLQLGTTATTAKAGSYVPALEEVTGTGTAGREIARQDSIAQVHAVLALVELIQDTLATTLVAGSGASLSYDDTNGRLTLNVAGGGTGTGTTDAEIVRDVIGAALVAGGGVQVLVNDAADTITVSALLRTVAGKAPDSSGNVTLAAGDLASGTLAHARLPVTSVVEVVQARGDFGAAAGSWPSARPSTLPVGASLWWRGVDDPGERMGPHDVWLQRS